MAWTESGQYEGQPHDKEEPTWQKGREGRLQRKRNEAKSTRESMLSQIQKGKKNGKVTLF